MAPSGVRVVSRLALFVAWFLGHSALFGRVGNPVGADQHVWLETFWSSVLLVGLLFVLLALTDLSVARVERRSDPDQRTAHMLAVLATGLVGSASVIALLAR